MSADIGEAEEASDEVMAAIAAGGTYSFVPEPDEDDSMLPGEDDLLAEVPAEVIPAADVAAVAAETEAAPPRTTRARTRKPAAAAVEAVEEEPALSAAESEDAAAQRPCRARGRGGRSGPRRAAPSLTANHERRAGTRAGPAHGNQGQEGNTRA